MPISIYISVNEDERVGGYPGFPRNKTCSNAFHQGKGGDRKEEKNIAQLKKMLKGDYKQRQLIPMDWKLYTTMEHTKLQGGQIVALINR